MNDFPRQKLCEIIAQYGRDVCYNPQQCEGLLKDFCGGDRKDQYQKEVFLLVNALKKNVAKELLKSQNHIPEATILAQLTKRLQNDLGISEESAYWAVDSWGLALEFISQPRVPNQQKFTLEQQQELESKLQQLEKSYDELKNQNSQVQSKLTTAHNEITSYCSQIRSRGIQRVILSIILVLMAIASGVIGYLGYKEIEKLKEKNSSTSTELESKKTQIEELNSSKDDLSEKLSALQSENERLQETKQATENDLRKFKEYYQNYLNKHKIIYQGDSLTWTRELSSSQKIIWTDYIILDQGSYLDVSLSNLTEDADADFEIFDSNGDPVPNSRKTKVGEDSLSDFYLSKGSYRIKVWLVGDDSTNYTLNIYRRM